MPKFIGAENGVVARFLPCWQGVPASAIDEWRFNGGNGDFSFGKYGNFPFLPSFITELDLEVQQLGESYCDTIREKKMRYADIFRFKSRYYALIVPFFDEVDTYYIEQKKLYSGDEKAIKRAFIVWQAHYVSLQALLDYVDFFFWREAAKVSGLPSNLRMWFKPRYSVDKGDFVKPNEPLTFA